MNRKDKWTENDDNMLTQTVIDHIRTGSTQLKAFAKVAEIQSRTAAACGFRWNAELRHRYNNEIKEAKLQGRQSKDVAIVVRNQEQLNPIDQIIDALEKFRFEHLEFENEIRNLKSKNAELELELEELRNSNGLNINPSDDLQTLLDLIRKAEGMIIERENKKPAYR
ncbi:hypothetical protein [Paenibacillus medicaginis]|uniref:RsfA family transcriptional regulator n=1 Tax=Paenibacillus medicaginis TaxID=1470560 RepID=A0ABV5BV84_9BACL